MLSYLLPYGFPNCLATSLHKDKKKKSKHFFFHVIHQQHLQYNINLSQLNTQDAFGPLCQSGCSVKSLYMLIFKHCLSGSVTVLVLGLHKHYLPH